MKKVYVVGNIAVDETWSIKQLPALGESILGNQASRDLGGKGTNQAVVLSRCNIDVVLIAGKGKDFPKEQEDFISGENLRLVPKSPVSNFSDRSIIFNTAIGDNAIITTNAAANALDIETVKEQLHSARPGDILLQQGNFSLGKTRAIFELAKTKNLITVFNPSPINLDFSTLWSLVDIAVLNEHEAQLLKPPVNHVCTIITQGSKGVVLTYQSTHCEVPCFPAQVVDTTGAGDTFLAVMLASSILRKTFPDAKALQHGAEAAAITVSQQGTYNAFPTKASLSAILNH